MSAVGKIPLLAELGLVVLLAWMASGWLLPGGDRTQPAGLTQSVQVSTAALPDLAELLAVPLFGKAAPKARQVAKPGARPAPVVVSRLNIKLLGTVVAGGDSAAIVSLASNGEQTVVFIGDDIQPGVKLLEVEAEAIVVERGDMLERVSLEQGEKLSSSPMQPVSAPGAGATHPGPATTVMPVAMQAAAPGVGGMAGANAGAGGHNFQHHHQQQRGYGQVLQHGGIHGVVTDPQDLRCHQATGGGHQACQQETPAHAQAMGAVVALP